MTKQSYNVLTRDFDGDFYPPKLWNSFSAAHLFIIGYFSELPTYNIGMCYMSESPL